MEFCPGCGIMLQYELLNMHDARFFCPTCPYVAYVDRKVKTKRRQHLVKKEIQPILTLDDYKNAPKTEGLFHFSRPRGFMFFSFFWF
ncbi:hypothetical protein C1H46_006549 [Malus baccata]|uniref:DNA-directed RNA polymerase II subunit RPB9-like zinc ribbon domain-containing protein n=1 Tax=Malus baccata TaxID=106549 RepID=A0A540NBC4_MALBA|nr:hypothetical protein C1H46_006549 [Malus baccata]